MLISFATISIVFLVFIGLPVALGLILIGVSLLTSKGLPLLLAPSAILSGLNDFVIISIPSFILMSNILLQCGVGQQLFKAVASWVGHLRGGLAIATILSCGLFSATSGSSVATSATIGVVAIPELRKHGYGERFIFGLLAAGGTLGILIPPSIPMIVYAFVIEESVIDMFTAGILPGILIIVLFSGYSVYHVGQIPGYRNMERTPMRDRVILTGRAFPSIFLIFVIIGGIYGGVFTPAEAAGIGVLVALLIGLFWTQNLSLRKLSAALRQTAITSVAILIILASAKLFGQTIAFYQLPQKLASFISENVESQWIFVLLVCGVLLGLGLFLEGISMVVLMMPVLYKSMLVLGIDPIWFGIIFVMMVEVALITPPVGLNLFIIQSIANTDVKEVFMGVRPFIALFFLAIGIVFLVPQVAVYLPELYSGR